MFRFRLVAHLLRHLPSSMGGLGALRL
jgi:hypothetical protein